MNAPGTGALRGESLPAGTDRFSAGAQLRRPKLEADDPAALGGDDYARAWPRPSQVPFSSKRREAPPPDRASRWELRQARTAVDARQPLHGVPDPQTFARSPRLIFDRHPPNAAR